MRIAKKRRERLFRAGKPIIRPAAYSDIRWMWAAAKREGFEGEPADFSDYIEPILAQADKVFTLEDRNTEFSKGEGPVGVVLSNHDGWSLVPHVEWFPWATSRNKLRCSVGFLQLMRYTHGVGCVKIFATDENASWFKWLRRYIPIVMVGKIPGGRQEGNEWIFYVRYARGRSNEHGNRVRRREKGISTADIRNPETASSHP